VAEAALKEGIDVYLYCIDDAVAGIGDEKLQDLRVRGLKLFACAYGAQRRNLALSEQATFSGLTILSEIIACTDRFLSFN
jgi:sulfur relay (sulfurtransferase) complex TusBCD TusD component (DsrE family)